MPPERTKNTINNLISEELSAGRPFHFKVSTLSMAPFIKPNDTVIVIKFSMDTLRCGDIVVFEKYGDFYTHRLLRKKLCNAKIKLITKGDNSFVIDVPVAREEFLGKVLRIERDSRHINLDSKLWRLINSLIGVLSYLEWVIFNFLRTFKRLVVKFE